MGVSPTTNHHISISAQSGSPPQYEPLAIYLTNKNPASTTSRDSFTREIAFRLSEQIQQADLIDHLQEETG